MKPLYRILILLSFNALPAFFSPALGQSGELFSRATGFIENKGQITDQNHRKNSSVKYLLRLPGGLNLQLRNNGYSYDTYRMTDSGSNGKPARYAFHRIDIVFTGANPAPGITVEDTLPFHYTYNTAQGNNLQVHLYGKVIYKDLYPSVDLVFERTIRRDSARGVDTRGVEYYFVVRPGGDPAAIRWKYKGGKKSDLENGYITVDLEKGQLREHVPMSYLDNSDRRQLSSVKANVAVRYKKTATDSYSFAIPTYDRKRTLVIDPTPDLVWGTYYGNGGQYFYGIARQSNGNIIVGGKDESWMSLATTGAYQTVNAGLYDALIAAFTKDGALLWATYYGGEGFDLINGIAVDGNNNIFICGQTNSLTGIATPGSYLATSPSFNPMGDKDAFLAKFDPNGLRVWSTYYGTPNNDKACAIAVDHNDNIVITGSNGISLGGDYDIFLAKFNQSGSRIWGLTYGSHDDIAYGVAIDPGNNIIITGSGNNILTTPGSYQPISTIPVGYNTFISKFSSTGSFIWGTYYGKNASQGSTRAGLGVTTDQLSNIYVVGTTDCSANISTPGAMQETYNTLGDGFIAKFDKNGGLLWGTYCGSNNNTYAEQVSSITTDGADNIWIGGQLGGTGSVVITPDAYQTTRTANNSTAFLANFNSAGVRQWGTYYGNTKTASDAAGIVNDADGNVYVAGWTDAEQNIATCGAVQPTFTGPPYLYSGYVAKFGKKDPAVTPAINISAATPVVCNGQAMTFTSNYKNEGATPSFTWLVNGQAAAPGTSSATLSQLADGDIVQCILDIHSVSACVPSQYPSNQIIVNVDPGTSPTVSIQTAATNICSGDKIKFTAITGDAGNQPVYQWSVNGIDAGVNGSDLVTTTLTDGDVVRCTVTKQDVCSLTPTAISSPITVSVRQMPVNNFSIQTTGGAVCKGDPATFSAVVAGSGSLSYQWLVDGVRTGGNTSSFTSRDLKDGDAISCLLTVGDGVCTFPALSSNTLVETVNPKPEIRITGDSILFRGGISQLNAMVGNINSGLSYVWAPAGSLSNPVIADPVAAPPKTTTYMVDVTTDEGCTAEKSIVIHLITNIVPPNAFSPNGDGNNDVFRIQYELDISDVHFYVYNRWGQLLFADEGTHQGWDGRFNGNPQPVGAYTWVFQYKDRDGNRETLKGTVELVR